MKVHVVYVEYNYNKEEPYIVGVYATENDAKAAADAEARTHAQEYGNCLWQRNPDTGAVDLDVEDSDWDVDIHVEDREVK